MNNKQDSKWWEFYGVRYAQGTVVGAMIVYFLFSQNDQLKKILFLPGDSKDFGMAHLALLAAFGLTYCYIASAPILIFHAGRGLLYKSATNPTPYKGSIARWVVLWALTLPIPLCYYYISTEPRIEFKLFAALVLCSFTFIISCQVILLFRIFHSGWKETIDYYVAIIDKRNEQKLTGYIESYKHIREHGNSFMIVLFEFLLAIPIFEFVSRAILIEDAIANLCLIIIFWLAPAMTIWAFGNKLENHMQSMQT